MRDGINLHSGQSISISSRSSKNNSSPDRLRNVDSVEKSFWGKADVLGGVDISERSDAIPTSSSISFDLLSLSCVRLPDIKIHRGVLASINDVVAQQDQEDSQVIQNDTFGLHT